MDAFEVLTVRPLDLLQPGVAARLLALQRRAYRIEAELIGYPALPPLRETEDDLRADPARFFVIADGDTLLAALSLDDTVSPPCISRLVVDPACFGRGLGSRLVEAVLARGREVEVGTAAANTPARRLYEKLGFRLVETISAPDGLALVRYRHPNL